MPVGSFIFQETSPSAAGTVASSQPVQSAAGYLPGGVAGPLDDYDSVGIDVDLQGATGGTLDLYIQQSPDGGLNWYDVVHFAQATAGHAVVYYSSPISQSTTTTAPTQVGKNLAPALGGSSAATVNGAFSDRMRLVMVASSGTTQGAPVKVTLSPQRTRAREIGD